MGPDPSAATDPGRKHLRLLDDDALAALIAANPSSKQGILAASIFKERESWRAPARWALIVATLSLVVSVAALVQS